MAATLPFALRTRALAALVILPACAVASPLLAQPRSVANLAVTNVTGNLYEEGARPGAQVYPATRELFFAEAPDLALGGPMPLVYQRYYAQYLAPDGYASSPLGTNWLGTWDWKLGSTGTDATVVTNRGRVIQFTSPTPGVWQQVSPLDVPYQLVQTGPEYRLLDPTVRRIFTFDALGNLVRVEDGRGNVHTLTYSGPLLAQVQDSFGRQLTFGYDPIDRLLSVSDGTRTVSYGHSPLGNTLASFTNAAGRTTTYNPVPLPPPDYALESAQLPAGNEPWSFSYSPLLEVSGALDFFGRGWNYTPGPGSTTLTDPNGGTRVYEYDARNRIIRVTNPLGNQTSYTYDATGRLETLTRPIVGTTSFGYHAPSGYRSSVTLPDLRAITLGFTERIVGGFKFYDLSLISYPDGTVESFTYDASGNPLTYVDRAGQTWSMTWTGFGMPATITNPAGGMTTLTYDVRGRVMVLLDAAGVSNEFTYDAMDRLIKVKHTDLTELNYAYDPLGNLTSSTNEVGAVYVFDYNLNGRLRKITDPVITERQVVYNGMDMRTAVTFADATQVTFEYDAILRPHTLSDRTARTVAYGYDAASRMTSVTDPVGSVRSFTYDANDRLLSDADALGNTHTLTWGAATDRITHWTDPLANLEQYGYDAMDRVTSADGPLGYNRSFGYEQRGLLNSVDELVLHMGIPRGALGQITSVLDPNLKSWLAQHDPAGRVTAHIDPVARLTSYTWDPRGRLSQVTRVGAGTLTFTYDAVSRVLQRSYTDGTTINYTYDAVGRLLATAGVSRTYDAWGRIATSNGMSVARDPSGRITGVTYAPGRTATYSYDPRGLLERIQDWLGGLYQFTYDLAGRRTRLTRPNGTITDYQYDGTSRLVRVVERKPPDTLSSTALTRDARGQVVGALRRVPLRPPAVATSRAYAYDDASQVLGWTYDDLGRLTDDDGPGPNEYQYNLASDLVSYSRGGASASFTYDGLGRPLSRTEGPVTRDWVWNDALSLPALSIVRQAAVDQSYFLYTPAGELLSRYDNPGGPCCAIRYSHFDESGNTLYLTDAAGNVAARYAYTPYGEGIEALPDPENLFTYGGQLGAMREGETGLYRMGGRIYDSPSARFMTGQGSWPTANTLYAQGGNPPWPGSAPGAGKIEDPENGPGYFPHTGHTRGGYTPKTGDRVTFDAPVRANSYQFAYQNPLNYSCTAMDFCSEGLSEPLSLDMSSPGFFYGAGEFSFSDTPPRPLWPPNHRYRTYEVGRSCLGSLKVASCDRADDAFRLLPISPQVPEPDVLNPIILNPIILNPIILNPAILNPIILNPIILNPIILNPIVDPRIVGNLAPLPRDRVYFYDRFDARTSDTGVATVGFAPSRPGQAHIQVTSDSPGARIIIDVRP